MPPSAELHLDLVPIPGGRVTLADARTRTTRSVELQPFEIARTPVTVEQFRALDATVLGVRVATPAAGGPSLPAHGVSWRSAVLWCNAAARAAGMQPAYRVDGDRVEWHASADGYRLLTEAEWEHACRAGSSGPTYGELEDIAWTALDGVDEPQPVALKQPNALGLADMLGNVWEWVWDHADTARYGDYRTLRGGGWADRPWSVRASVRRSSAPDAVLDDVGFRVARGPVAVRGADEVQGWSRSADARRAGITGPRPVGWTPLDPSLR